MEFRDVIKNSSYNFIVLFFGCTMVRPCQVLQMSDDALFSNHQFAFDQVWHDWFYWFEDYLRVVKFYAFFDIGRPVLITLLFSVFFRCGEHHYKIYIVFFDQSPKIFCRCIKRPLGSNKQLIISGDRSIYIVSIYEWVVDIFISLDESDPSMFDYQLSIDNFYLQGFKSE